MIQEFRSVSFFRGRKLILNDITFQQPKNVSIGILGSRGSGKTSLLNLAIGAMPPDRGRIRRTAVMSMPIGSPATLHQKLTGREITRLSAGLYGVDANLLCRFISDFAELGPSFRKPFGQFSSAERSRFIYALSYGIPADCYMADNPLLGGDAGFRDKIRDLALTRKREAAFFFTSVSVNEMRLFADVGGVLRNGSIDFYPSVEAAISVFEAEAAPS